jgi:hypothetical protein
MDAVAQLRTALAGGIDTGNVVVMILPAELVPAVFGSRVGSPSSGPDPERDFTVAEYRRRYEPELSASRIREQCGEGFFPTSLADDGTEVPGAYRDSRGQWRITREGIAERQRRDRQASLEQARGRYSDRDSAVASVHPLSHGDQRVSEEATGGRTAEVPIPAPSAESQARKSGGRAAASRRVGGKPVRSWREVRGIT